MQGVRVQGAGWGASVVQGVKSSVFPSVLVSFFTGEVVGEKKRGKGKEK